MEFIANKDRYQKMIYRKCHGTGLKLPAISLGLWLNFGGVNDYELCRNLVFEAFNRGITHFDLANNYGPPAGSAEENFGKILRDGLMKYRDEIIISTKAGYGMWPGPYGDGGSRKYLIASLDQSLKRMGIPYVDIFYHHRYDKDTPLEETMLALRDIVLSGKALYVGLSNYNSDQLKKATKILKELHVPYVLTQPNYSMLNRWIEQDQLPKTCEEIGMGIISFSALAQGRLSNKYIAGIPEDSRAKKDYIQFLSERDITPELVEKLKKLNVLAEKRGQTISQMALSWVLRNVTSTLIGVSKMSQLEENLACLEKLEFTQEELEAINAIL